MDPSDYSHESRPSNQYTDFQDRHRFAEPTGNYHSTDIGDANSPRTILSGTSTRSSVPSQNSFASASTTANTASTSRTSLGLSSSAHSMASGHTRQETVVATASTQAGSANTKPTMYCVCCWKSNADLTRHYRERCLYIHGNWAFWACPYTSEVLGDQQAFINHMKSFKLDEKRIAVTQTVYVTPRDWAVHFAEDAKKRQLVNTVLAYFRKNPGLAREWKALNNGELVPDVNNVGDVGRILAQSSILRCRPPLGSAHSVQTVPIEQLRQLLQAGKAVINSIPVPYNALQIVNRGSRVTIGDAHFDSAELAERQQQQLYREDQERSFRYGGVFVHSRSGTAALAPTNTSSTARTLSTFANQTQETYIVPNNVSGNPAEAQFELQNDLMDHGGFELSPPIPQTLQQTQSADILAGANDLFSASADDHIDDYVDKAFWESLLND